jgi:2-methylcitrate dehydratase PrpD
MTTTDARPIGRQIAATLAAIGYDDIPEDVVRIVKLFTLDTLGVIGGAARAPGMMELLAALTEWEQAGKSTLLLNGRTANPATAALANGAAAHSLDFDDQHDQARIHAFCVVLPAVLAAVEAKRDVTGREAILALAVGVELFCRLGLACHNSLGKGWHPTTALGSISAAAACAKVFGLEAEKTLHAMALAFVQLSGTTQFIADGALAKRIGPGFAARSGLLAAQMAKHGVTGPWRFLEGKAGLFELHERGEVSPEMLTDGLGESWRIRELSMKPYPCCRCTHTVIQLALDLHADGVKPEDIESGVIELGKVNRQIVGSRFDQTHPNPVVHAQFNAAYAFAAALVDGKVGITTYTPERIRAADVAFGSLLDSADAADIEPTAVPPARVRLQLKSGRSLELTRWTMKGAPDDPMSLEETVAKFRACLRWGMDADETSMQALEDAVMSLDTLAEASILIGLFRGCERERQAA